MGKFLSIIIPSYQESELQIYPLLASICCQTGVDFSSVEIIIMKDGGGHLYSEAFCKLFPVEILEYALPENVGPGLAREAGIGVSSGEYVMFCDADDSLYEVTALQTLISVAKQEQCDIIRSDWLEEAVSKDGIATYLRKTHDNTWMHGKLFKRQFLIDNDIHFHPELRVHEDTYFLSIAAACTDKSVDAPVTSYLWKFNPDSITRRNGHEYRFKSFAEFVKASGLSHDVITKRNPAIMEYKVVQVTCYVYFTLHDHKWQDESVYKWRDETECNFVKYHSGSWQHFLDAPRSVVERVYNEERQKHFTKCIEVETLGKWLHRIGMGLPTWMEV